MCFLKFYHALSNLANIPREFDIFRWKPSRFFTSFIILFLKPSEILISSVRSSFVKVPPLSPRLSPGMLLWKDSASDSRDKETLQTALCKHRASLFHMCLYKERASLLEQMKTFNFQPGFPVFSLRESTPKFGIGKNAANSFIFQFILWICAHIDILGY